MSANNNKSKSSKTKSANKDNKESKNKSKQPKESKKQQQQEVEQEYLEQQASVLNVDQQNDGFNNTHLHGYSDPHGLQSLHSMSLSVINDEEAAAVAQAEEDDEETKDKEVKIANDPVEESPFQSYHRLRREIREGLITLDVYKAELVFLQAAMEIEAQKVAAAQAAAVPARRTPSKTRRSPSKAKKVIPKPKAVIVKPQSEDDDEDVASVASDAEGDNDAGDASAAASDDESDEEPVVVVKKPKSLKANDPRLLAVEKGVMKKKRVITCDCCGEEGRLARACGSSHPCNRNICSKKKTYTDESNGMQYQIIGCKKRYL